MSAPVSLLPPRVEERLIEAAGRLPEHCREGLVDYIRYGRPPGSFIYAVLTNNLLEACRRADHESRLAIFDYVFVLANCAPAQAWGDESRVAEWIDCGRRARETAAVE